MEGQFQKPGAVTHPLPGDTASQRAGRRPAVTLALHLGDECQGMELCVLLGTAAEQCRMLRHAANALLRLGPYEGAQRQQQADERDARDAAAPGAAIFVVSLAFNLLGDGLRDALDPKAVR